ncbi:DNA gyrase, A subunit [Capnocytophaga sp. oral taxon 863 str. F0517]|uniref:DNA gyrase subunit A n=1 Tax=Capnocytophaga sp. oral taxon 863 TaxID=1227265 RepID=UPI0003985735|nr:DNA gyrase subunit A [Capnocytophaga sp. oral taxon 863]ERI64634.1 DNA gyrase, A subunit [Capnocytophaga sp. oral taxon 863 str. F0517]
MVEGEKLIPINIEDQMKTAYIDYSMSVIVSRALPDVRDGLKPVHRRVLFGMLELGVRSNTTHKKSARIVGEVLGKYHPHGDSSVYDTMVRMAQWWNMRYMLVDGQGNFGSIDGDPPAAMRYTEARMRKIAEDMLIDIDKETVDHSLNFDDTLEEPTVLPTRIPNLLVNGAAGIAVGMATNMPPHNLAEVVDGTIAYLDNQDITIDELMEYIKAPDFPTGGIIYGYDGVREAFKTGRGRVVIRAKAHFEEINNRDYIVVTEVPYQVNPETMREQTSNLVKEGKLEGLADIVDQTGKGGMRIVYELKKDAIPNVVLNNLFKHTALQSSFSVNNIALVNGRPEQLNLKDLIYHFVEHRYDVVYRRTQYELKKAKERIHILEGLMKIMATEDTLDRAIAIIRHSKPPKPDLMAEFELTDMQATAILNLRLQSINELDIIGYKEEYEKKLAEIIDLEDILAHKERRTQIIKDELLEIKAKYGDERKSVIEYAGGDISIEDIIPNEQVVITISNAGYIKRTPVNEYKTQARGGVGQKASATRDKDFIEHLFVGTNHQYMLFFTEKGKCFWLRVYEIPEGGKNTKGRAIQNLINIASDDLVKAVICTHDLKEQDYINSHYVIMATKKGVIKKTCLEQYSRPRQNGIVAITIKEDDELLEARLTSGNSQVMLAVKSGKAIRFPEEKVRAVGRSGSGVRGISLESDKDEVIGMIAIENPKEETVLVVSENGYGKRTFIDDPETGEAVYRITNRGGKGVKTISVTDKTGNLVAIKSVLEEDDLMIINKSGMAIRLPVSDLRVMGRATQGVRLINIKGNDSIAAVAKVMKEDEEELPEGENTQEPTPTE